MPAFTGPFKLKADYTQLPPELYVPQLPTPVKQSQLLLFNNALANTLGLPKSEALDWTAYLSGNIIFPDSAPIAKAYAGHQFGHFTILGDGRAILLGEYALPDGELVDIELKGAGQTPFSRRGDGRAALGPMLREYLISEAMHALGIPTTRSLAVISTGEPVYRETPLEGAILTRIARSHIRVGTFEYAATLNQPTTLKALADYTIERHYSHLSMLPTSDKYREFLRAVIQKQAELIAQWQSIGFVHGVMNTDNMSISGETIDYGPCAFMDTYHPKTVFSSIDHYGRYAYQNQPSIGLWNLARFAETVLPLFANSTLDDATHILETFMPQFQAFWYQRMCNKLALNSRIKEHCYLVDKLLSLMQRHCWDYTDTFWMLTCGTLDRMRQSFNLQDTSTWLDEWHLIILSLHGTLESAQQAMAVYNPSVIPRNHIVEKVLDEAVQNHNLEPFQQFCTILQQPYQSTPQHIQYQAIPPQNSTPYKTFCGT